MPRPSIVPHELLREIPDVDATVLATVAAGLGAGLLIVVQMVLLSRIIQGVLLAHQRFEAVIPLLSATALVMVARAAFIFMREVISRRGASHVQMMVRERLLRHLLQLGPAYLNRERTGELVVAATEGIDRLGPYVSRYLPQRLLSIGVPLLVVAVVLPYDWVSALLLVASAPIILLLLVLIGGYTEERTQRQWETLGRLSARFLDAIQGLPTLMVFDGGEKQGRKRVVESSEEFRVQTLGVLRIATISGATLELMTAVAIGLVAATLGVRLLDRGIAFDHAFLVFLLTPEFYRPLRELGVQRHAAMEGTAAARRIMEILSVPSPPASRFHAVEEMSRTPPASPHSAGAIELVNLGYSYPASMRPALDGVGLTLQPGTCTALVGTSGAGKTTLVNLLLRFIEPTSGTILLGGIPSTLFGVDEWRARVALVPQQPYLLTGSVRDNIRLANPRATDREVRLAAEMAGIHRFLVDLPHGYDTPLGERGYGLSAGQRQRLALARAFLKNAPILILDEPTSALDPESELLVRAGIKQLRSSRSRVSGAGHPVSSSGLPVLDCRMVLIVAHRLNTVLSADQVAVLEDGRVVEAGTHLELLDRGGAYARLLRADTRAGALA